MKDYTASTTPTLAPLFEYENEYEDEGRQRPPCFPFFLSAPALPAPNLRNLRNLRFPFPRFPRPAHRDIMSPAGRMPEWTKGTDCKSVCVSSRGFESHCGLSHLQRQKHRRS